MNIDDVYALEQKEFEEALGILMHDAHFRRVMSLLDVRTARQPTSPLNVGGLDYENFVRGERALVELINDAIKEHDRVPDLHEEVQRNVRRRDTAASNAGPPVTYTYASG